MRTISFAIGTGFLLAFFACSDAATTSDLTIAISHNVEGIMARRSPSQDVVFTFKGTNFVKPNVDGLQSSYEINFEHPPKFETGPKVDPFKVIEELICLKKADEETGVRQLIEPHPDPKVLTLMDRPDVRQNDKEVYESAKSVSILFGFESEDRFVVFYRINRHEKPVVNADELTEIDGLYYLRAQETQDRLDYNITDIFTGLYAETHAKVGSIKITSQ